MMTAIDERLTSAKRILIVDDEANISRIIKFNLEQEGFEVETAADGFIALSRVRAASPDLIVLDLIMPKMDGWEVAQQLKQDPATARIPILMLSIVQDREKGQRAGAAGYLLKPFSMDDLLREVRGLLGMEVQS
ncbi:MAG TPA: response regulator [Methylomirabilota bacterium]|nr:response regulator [Methylomirabilota bacterium]